MITHTKRYTFMRKSKRTGKIEEGISSNDGRVMDNLMRAARIEDKEWTCWIAENKTGAATLSDVFIQP